MTRKRPLTLKERIRIAKKAGRKLSEKTLKFARGAAAFGSSISEAAAKIEKKRAEFRRDFQGPQIDQDFWGFDTIPRKRRRRNPKRKRRR
jgi:hypothetical protein